MLAVPPCQSTLTQPLGWWCTFLANSNHLSGRWYTSHFQLGKFLFQRLSPPPPPPPPPLNLHAFLRPPTPRRRLRFLSVIVLLVAESLALVLVSTALDLISSSSNNLLLVAAAARLLNYPSRSSMLMGAFFSTPNLGVITLLHAPPL